MRYDNLLSAIDRAKARYEAEMRAILADFAQRDEKTAALVSQTAKDMRTSASTSAKKRMAKAALRPHWTQTPEGKKKLARSMRRAWKKKRQS